MIDPPTASDGTPLTVSQKPPLPHLVGIRTPRIPENDPSGATPKIS